MTGRFRAAVLAAGVALVVGGYAVGTWIAGDGDGRAPTGATTSTPPAAAGTGPEGTIRLGVPEEPASLDPFDRKSRTRAAAAVLGAVLPQLFRVDPAGRTVGWLADDATVRAAPDGSSATFSLRAGARWSDGPPITAEDLRFTLATIRGPAWPGPRGGYDRLTAVEGDGAEVTFRFDGPFPGWRRLFSGADFVLPAHRLAGRDLRAEWVRGPDTFGGPFRLGAVTPGLSVVLERNDSWWGEPARAAAISVLVVPDVRTMEQLLTRGELDVAWPPAITNRIGRFRAVPGVEVSVAEPGGTLELLVANTAAVPVERRRAFLGLANRDRFVDVLLAGEAGRAVSLAGPDGAVPAAGAPGDAAGGGGSAGSAEGVAGEGGSTASAEGAAGEGGSTGSVASGEPAPAGGPAWATAGLEPAGGRLAGAGTISLAMAEEDPFGPLLGRVLQTGAREDGATVELKADDAGTVEGTWVPEGRFDLALVRTVAWPRPCWTCRFGEDSTGRGNAARVGGLTALAAAADRDPAAAAALETRLRDEAVLLPLWRPRAVLAGRGITGLEANSWAIGPFWGAESWGRRP